MSEQSSTTTNSPSEPRLCKMGCGFFGSQATGDYCSKCYTDMIKRQQKKGETATATANTAICQPAAPTPMEVDADVSANANAKANPPSAPAASAELTSDAQPQPESQQPAELKPATATATAGADTPPKVTKKKKKKKTSYKDMMASMTKRTKDERDIQKEKENLRKVTGGGTFSKIDKI